MAHINALHCERCNYKKKRHQRMSSHLNLEGKGTPLQYSCLENPMDGGAWQAIVHGVTNSQTRLSDFTFRASLVAQRLKRLPAMRETWVRSLGWGAPLEKEMATHSSILAWRIPWKEEPSRLQSTGSQRVGHD